MLRILVIVCGIFCLAALGLQMTGHASHRPAHQRLVTMRMPDGQTMQMPAGSKMSTPVVSGSLARVDAQLRSAHLGRVETHAGAAAVPTRTRAERSVFAHLVGLVEAQSTHDRSVVFVFQTDRQAAAAYTLAVSEGAHFGAGTLRGMVTGARFVVYAFQPGTVDRYAALRAALAG